jgi:exopolysaccharide biosynthesis polyprenyl glycosylphosphotransferase
MNRFRREVQSTALKVGDMLLMFTAVGLAVWFTYDHGRDSISEFFVVRTKLINIILFGAFAMVWHTIFSIFSLYESRRLSTEWNQALDVLKATSCGTLAMAASAPLFDIEMFSYLFLVTFWVISTTLTITCRMVLRQILARARAYGRNLRNVLIVGTNGRALRFAAQVEARSDLGYRLVGFMDEQWGNDHEFAKSGHEVVVNFDRFPRFLREHLIDEVVIGLPMGTYYRRIADIIRRCEEQGILVRILGDIFNLRLDRVRGEEFGDDLVLTLATRHIQGPSLIAKRIMDLFISLPLTIMVSPLFAVTALAIKLTSPGPVIFVQDRIGLDKRPFRLYKFRTMVVEAQRMQAQLEHLNEADGAAFKIANDPRVTPLGKILRKTSVDELPQLFNVLKGDMSLVGPRPLPVRDYENFEADCHRRRFIVRPGLTCLWQVDGRNSRSFENWMELDLRYIDQWSLSLDLKILAKTIPAVVKGVGAV